MKTYNTPLCRRIVLACLTAGMLGVIGSPAPAQAVEREGTTLFLSLAEVKAVLRVPPFSLFAPGIVSYLRPEWQAKDSRIERNVRWGHGLGVDGHVAPGSRRPLWGY
jgi:hypothetical protein